MYIDILATLHLVSQNLALRHKFRLTSLIFQSNLIPFSGKLLAKEFFILPFISSVERPYTQILIS